MKNDSEHFGVPAENIRAAQLRASGTRDPLHCSVPTKKEIATLALPELKMTLIAWMEHSAIEIIPSRAQIALVRDVLLARRDAPELVSLVRMCSNYIEDG